MYKHGSYAGGMTSGRTAPNSVEIVFAGDPPARRLERASGVSEVQVNGSVVRCRVSGCFQPFLEALFGYEVMSLHSTPSPEAQTSSDSQGGQ